MIEGLTFATPRAQTFFCDDVRTEMGGKFSIMGLYQDMIGILVPEATLPKLTIFTIFDFPPSFAGRAVELALWQGLEKLGGGTAMVPQQNESFAKDSRIPSRCRMNVPFELVNVTLKDGMSFQIRARCQDYSYDSPKLDVLCVPGISTPADVPSAAVTQVVPQT